MTVKLSTLIKLPGIHFLVTRHGPKWMKSLAFDEKYRSGDWDFSKENSNDLVQVVANYANRGDILIMGCGSASFLAHLEARYYSSILGVDLSKEAVRLASKHSNSRIHFQIGDMMDFECERPYDVILFSESLYYVPALGRRQMLKILSGNLKSQGCFIVTIAQAKRYEGILAMIREGFEIIEDRNFRGSKRHLMVFRDYRGTATDDSGLSAKQSLLL